MNRDEALKLLLVGSDGVREWNRLIEQGEKSPDLCEADLRRADLPGIDLRGVKLCRAKLSRINLFRAKLEGADLSEVDLEDAKRCVGGSHLTL
jgi:hypothetical protein